MPSRPVPPQNELGSSHGHCWEEFLSTEHPVVPLAAQDLPHPWPQAEGFPSLSCVSSTGGLLPRTTGERVQTVAAHRCLHDSRRIEDG